VWFLDQTGEYIVMMFLLRGKIFASKEKEVPTTAISGRYGFILRLAKDGSVEKIFTYQPGGFYKAADGELIPVYTVQRIRWKHIEGEGYILSNNPFLPIQEPYNKTMAPASRRIRLLLATLKKN